MPLTEKGRYGIFKFMWGTAASSSRTQWKQPGERSVLLLGHNPEIKSMDMPHNTCSLITVIKQHGRSGTVRIRIMGELLDPDPEGKIAVNLKQKQAKILQFFSNFNTVL